MRELILSVIQFVNQFGYIVIPIETISNHLKEELNIQDSNASDIVLVNRQWLEKGEDTALNLGYIIKRQAVYNTDYNSVIMYVVKQPVRHKNFLKNLLSANKKLILQR